MRRPTTWFAGLLLALFLLGLSVVPLTMPGFTRRLAAKTSLSAEAGLPLARMVQIAETVRAFVVDNEAPPLPAVVDGRPGFDEGAVSHLIDVRHVLAGARVVTGVLAAVLALLLAYEVTRRRTDRVADALMAGAICSAVLVVLCVIAATTNFDAFFSAFHGLFFKAGTWTFPSDSLLIETFPETFWTVAGGVWGGLVLVEAALLALGARTLRQRGAAQGA